MMYDFRDVAAASKGEQIRAWSVEQSADYLQNQHRQPPYQDVISLAKMIEDYVTNGDVSGVIQNAVEEDYSEGRQKAREY